MDVALRFDVLLNVQFRLSLRGPHFDEIGPALSEFRLACHHNEPFWVKDCQSYNLFSLVLEPQSPFTDERWGIPSGTLCWSKQSEHLVIAG